MPVDPKAEVEAFVRFLAMNPHKLEAYAADPNGFLAQANVGAQACAALEALGVERLRDVVGEMGGQIHANPDTAIIARDETVQGFGAKPSGA